MRPIRICYVIGSLDIGGAERHLAQVVQRLDRSLFAPQVCVLTRAGVLASEVEAAGVSVTVLGFKGFLRGGPLAPLRGLGRFVWLMRFFRRERFDMVHAYLFWAYVLAVPAARLAGVPIVLESRRSLGLFKDGRPHYVWLEGLTNPLADLFVANSQAVRDDAIRREGIRADKIRVIYNGVDAPLYAAGAPSDALRRARAELRIAPGTPVILVLARLYDYKGHAHLLEAVSALTARNREFRVLLVGEGPEEEDLKAEARRLGLADRVAFVGERTDVLTLLTLSDMSVLPSLQEGFSNTVIESMAAGRAVVATAVGGNPEAIEDGVTGLLVSPGDPAALASAIERLLVDPDLRTRLGEAAQRLVAEKFSIESMMAQMTDMYLDVWNGT